MKDNKCAFNVNSLKPSNTITPKTKLPAINIKKSLISFHLPPLFSFPSLLHTQNTCYNSFLTKPQKNHTQDNHFYSSNKSQINNFKPRNLHNR